MTGRRVWRLTSDGARRIAANVAKPTSVFEERGGVSPVQVFDGKHDRLYARSVPCLRTPRPNIAICQRTSPNLLKPS
jgi:hypothetical protein